MLGAMASVAPEEKPQGQETPLQKIVRQALAKSAEAAKRSAAARYVPPDAPVIPTREELAAQASPPATAQTPKPTESAAQASEEGGAAPDDRPAGKPAQSELSLPGGSAADPLGALSPALRELLEALGEDIKRKEAVRRRVSWDETGNWLLVDTNLLGAYGMTANGVASALRKAKVAEDGNGRSLRIVEAIGQVLLSKAA